jgi:rSAM/selenodomain-associated transferase 1
MGIPGIELSPSGRLTVLLKAPRLGTVKTRLAADLGPESALAAYRRLVEALLAKLSPLPHVDLRFAPDDAGSEIAHWLQSGWTSSPQGAGDLGVRLEQTFTNHFSRSPERLVVIGADCPEVAPTDIQTAWSALEATDVVLGPATDGGYWLIGLKAPRPALFQNMPWSTDTLLKETLGRAAGLGLTVATLRTLSDVDTLGDWLRVEPTLPLK